MNAVRRGLILALLTASAGCLQAEPPNLFGSRAERLELVEVTVENTLASDVTIHAYWERRSTRVRLGIVPAFSTRTFTTPWWSAGIRFVSSDRTEYYPVEPGDQLQFVVGGATSMIPRRVRG